MEGQTATNPTTGERIVMRGGQWVPLTGSAPSAPATGQARPFGSIVVKEGDPYADTERRLGIQRDQQGITNEAIRTGIARSADARAADRERREAEREGLTPGYRWTDSTHSSQQIIPGGPADKKAEGAPIPAWAATPYEQQIGIYGGVDRGLRTFQDSYAGNTLTGGLENALQGVSSSFGTPGQRDWWAQFGSTDNVIRNDLFGAALTEHEKAAYAATTINPRMDPKEVRRNLQSREEILAAALRRRTAFLRAQGYNDQSIEALAGEFAQQLGAVAGLSGAAGDGQAGLMPGARSSVSAAGGGNPGTLVPTDVANAIRKGGLTDAQANAYDAFMRANPNANAQQLQAFAQSMGLNLSNAEDIIRARNAGGGFLPGETGIIRAPDISDARGRGGLGEGADAFVRGAADTVSLGFGDELAAAGDTLFGGGTMDDNLARQRAIDAYDAENSPWLRGAGQLAGGLALPVGRVATAGDAVRVGAGYGGAYGFGSGDGIADRLTGAGAGALTGGAIAGGLQRFGGAIGSRLARGRDGNPEARGIYEAAQRQGVDLLPADVGGDMTRRFTAGAAQTPLGAGPILSAARRAQDQAAGVVRRTASAVTEPADQYGAGRAAQRGAERFVSDSEKRAGRLYDAISVPDRMPAVTDASVSALERITQGMESNPELSRIWTGHPRLRATMEALRRPNVRERSGPAGYPMLEKEVIENGQNRWVPMSQREIEAGAPEGGQVSWADMKRLRSIIGEIVGKPSFGSEGNEIAANRALYAALSDDMRATAERAGPEALRQFERANGFWRGRQDRIANVVVPILGKEGGADGQAAFNAIQNWAGTRGESSRVGRLMRSIPKDEAETIGATFISELGRPSAGRLSDQNPFSLSDFATHWNKLDQKAKSALFTKEQNAALNDLFTIASGTKEAQRFANTSNTAGALMSHGTTVSTIAGLGAAATGQPLAALAAFAPAIGQYVTGRMLASPKFVERLAMAAKAKTPGAQRARLQALSSAIARDPALAQEGLGLQQYIAKVANDNVANFSRSAASGAAGGDDRNQANQ